jgi:3-methylcrotonyl-CoA carboxylase alpha subunit
LGRAIGYDSVGTVEFLLARDGDTPCFLELNTRLQVEHTVTEQITGLDLVEWQIRLAFGDALPLAQNDVHAKGWAIEARVNSEDAARGYRPEPGIVTVYSESCADGVRIDSGIEAGSVVSLHYDSLLAKVIGYGATRAVAARRLDEGLAKLEVGGLVTNQSFLREILAAPSFLEAPLDTDFIVRNFPSGWRPQREIATHAALVATLATLFPFPRASTSGSPWEDKTGFRLMKAAGCRGRARMMVRIEGEGEMAVDITDEGEWLRALVGTETWDGAFCWIDPRHVELRPKSGAARRFTVSPSKGGHSVWHVGLRFECLVEPRLEALARVESEQEQGRDAIVSPMPGLVVAVNVTAGETVARGSQVAVIEAMKLVFHLQADIDGRVRAVLCSPGDVVVSGQRLLEIDPV